MTRVPHKLLSLAALSLILTGCMRIYHADIAGYVKDVESANGINGAVVRIYSEEPATADAEGFIIETATTTSGGNDGYYNHKIIWQTNDPAFGEEGDSGTVWIGVIHEDYFGQVVSVRGIISGSLNYVRDISIQSYQFECPEIRGRVVDANGDGVNGVRVVLDLQSTADDDEDYVSFTQTSDEEVGTYIFTEVRWRDEADIDVSTEDAAIYVADVDFYSDVDLESPLDLTLTNDEESLVATDIVVQSTDFTATVVAGLVYLGATGTTGQNGVSVYLDLISTDAEPDYIATTSTYEGVDGTYRFEGVSWSDSNPEPPGADPDSDSEDVRLYIVDTEFYSGTDVDAPLPATIDSDVDNAVATALRVESAEFSVAEVKGAVTLAGVGRNGITVALDITSTLADPDYTATTANDGSGDGVFTFTDVTWLDNSPEATDDTEEARIYVADSDFNADYDAADPFLTELTSGTDRDFTATPYAVSQAIFDCSTVSGQVLDAGADGLDGVRVVLDLLSTTGNDADYVTTTSTIGGVPGSYQFLDVEWSDEDPDAPGSDTESCEIRVEDGDYETTVAAAVLTLDSDTAETAGNTTVERKIAWEFSAVLNGRCIYREGVAPDIQETPIRGVEVTIDAAAGNGASLINTNATSIIVETGTNGEFSANLTWVRDRTYNPQADSPGTVPPAEEDVLLLDITYSSNVAAGNIYTFTDLTNHELKSWVGTTTVPDAVDTDPNN